MAMPRFEIKEDDCKLCAVCVEECPAHVLAKLEDKIIPEHPERCLICKTCEDVCPQNVIHVELSFS